MKKTTKIITTLVALAIFIELASPLASAQTLREIDATARARYQQVRQQYLYEVNAYRNARQDFLNAIAGWQRSRNTENKRVLEDKARGLLEKIDTSMIKRLETIKNWTANRRGISESERQAVITEVDQDINWLNERLSKIQNASPEQIREEAKTIREYLRNHRGTVDKKIIGQLWTARINYIVTNTESFSTKINAKIDELEAAGQDTTQLEAWLSNFNGKIALAKEKKEAAEEKFQAITSSTSRAEAEEFFQQGHQFIQEAHQYLKEAYAQLVQIVKEMKKMGETIEGLAVPRE